MAPKQIHGKGGRTVAEPSFARSAIQTIKSPENRSVITAVGLFAVREPLPLEDAVDQDRSAWTRRLF